MFSFNQSRNGTPLPEATWLLLLTLTVSFVLVGGCVGSASCKFFMTILSRKRLLQLGHFTNLLSVLIMSLVGSLTWSYEAVIIGRCILGIPLGMYFSKFAVYRPNLRAFGVLYVEPDCRQYGTYECGLLACGHYPIPRQCRHGYSCLSVRCLCFSVLLPPIKLWRLV